MMDPDKRPADDASGDGRSMRRHLTRVGSPSGGGRWSHPPLGVSLESAQPSDAALVTAVKTELERLRRYLEVSQVTLEVAERETQAV
jgi:hypothetical protein